MGIGIVYFRVRRQFLNDNTAKSAGEVPALLRESERNSKTEDALMQWSADTLRQVLVNELPGSEVIVVSNREPYIHEIAGEDVELRIPASGLVSALEPITRTCAGTWIA